jgi:hypothetical protein
MGLIGNLVEDHSPLIKHFYNQKRLIIISSLGGIPNRTTRGLMEILGIRSKTTIHLSSVLNKTG